SRRGGRRADKAQCPDYSGRGVRITPDDEVHLRCTSRLAARQRGILAFMPLTVVGPGRLIVAGEAARVRPGDEVASPIARRCRSRSPAYTTPHECAPRSVGRDRLSIVTLLVKSRTISLMVNGSMVRHAEATVSLTFECDIDYNAGGTLTLRRSQPCT